MVEKDPLNDYEKPSQYPLILLPPYRSELIDLNPRDSAVKANPGLTELFMAYANKQPLFGTNVLPPTTTIGDVVEETLIDLGTMSSFKDGKWVVDGKVSPELIDRYSGPLYEAMMADRQRIESGMHVLDFIRYSDLATGLMMVPAHGRLAMKQLSEKYEPHGISLDPISKLSVVTAGVEAIGLLSYSYISNSRHRPTEAKGIAYVLSTLKDISNTVVAAGHDTIENYNMRRLWRRWFRVNVAPIMPLQLLRSGHVVDEIGTMHKQIKGAVGEAITDYSKGLLTDIKDSSPKIEALKEKHPVIYRALSGVISSSQGALENVVETTRAVSDTDEKKAQVEGEVKDRVSMLAENMTPEEIQETSDRSRTKGHEESALHHSRNKIHGGILEAATNRGADLISIAGYIASGVRVAANVAIGQKDRARAADVTRYQFEVMRRLRDI